MMEDKWCPENDGAYRMEMAAIHRDSVDQQLHRASAEITQLRAELADMTRQADAEALYSDGLRAEIEQERELADRLYSAIEYIDDYCLAYPELEAVSAVSSSAIDYVDTRRNK